MTRSARTHGTALLILLAGPLAGPAAAQTTVSVPAHADQVDGHQSVDLPFGRPGFRTQILLDGAAVAPNNAVITELRFRADRASAPLPAASVPNVAVAMSHCSLAASALGTTFAANQTGPATAVFQGTVALPAQQEGAAGPLGWDVVVPLATAYVFTPALGNLLIDITANNAPGAATWQLDAVEAGGSATQFGRPGDNPTFDTLRLLASTGNDLVPQLIAPGGFVEITTTTGFTTPPGLLVLGLLPVDPPFDLGAIGAPTHLQYVAPLATFLHGWQGSFIGWFSTVRIDVPGDPAFVGLRLYAQSTGLEPAANALGLVTSNALEVRIGDALAPLPLRQVDAADPTALTGTLVDFSFGTGTRPGAVPVRLVGVFQ